MNEADRFLDRYRLERNKDGTCRTQDGARPSSAKPLSSSGGPLHVPRSEHLPPAQTSDAADAVANGTRWWILASVAGGLFGAIAAMLEEAQYGLPEPVAAVLVAPVAEEILKIAVPVMRLEHGNGKIRQAKELLFASAGSGLMFGLLENAVYTWVYYPGALSPGTLVWRWCGCTFLHGFWSVLAGTGAARAFASSRGNGTKPRFIAHVGWLVAAVILHALYNLFAMIVASA